MPFAFPRREVVPPPGPPGLLPRRRARPEGTAGARTGRGRAAAVRGREGERQAPGLGHAPRRKM